MGKKRTFEDVENVEEKAKVSKKSKHSLGGDETIEEEEEVEKVGENGGSLPTTRRELMELPYESKLEFVSVIANPIASKKLGKKLFKLMRKAGKISRKTLLRIGLKEVQMRIRKGKVFSKS